MQVEKRHVTNVAMVAGLANFPENGATVKTLASTGNFRPSRATAFGVITACNLNTKEGKEAGLRVADYAEEEGDF